MFSDILRGKKIGRFRKVSHSFSNYFTSIDSSSFGLSSSSKREKVQGFTGVALNTGDKAGAIAGIAAGAVEAFGATAAVAEGAVFGSAFFAACAGPQVAVTTAVLGLVLLVKGAYSNRESAHDALSNYVWNMVDDEPPVHGVRFTAEHLKNAADAATTLLEDGKDQIKIMGTKLAAAQKKIAALNTTIQQTRLDWNTEKNKLSTTPQNKSVNGKNIPNPEYKRITTNLNRIKNNAKKLWEAQILPDGAIFEYVRRCSHTGNYIQASHIVALAMKEEFSLGSVTNHAQPDYFANSQTAIALRDSFTNLASLYLELETFVQQPDL